MCGKFTQRQDVANVVRLSEAFAFESGAEEKAPHAAPAFERGGVATGAVATPVVKETVAAVRHAQTIVGPSAEEFVMPMRTAQAIAGPAGDETVTPMRYARVIALDGQGVRKSVAMRWGLIPSFARDDAKPFIHARAETIDVKPTFRDSFARRRGIVLTTTFNEAEEVDSKTVQYVLTPLDAKPVAIAVIWDLLREPDGRALLTFAMVTAEANPLIAAITDRMPALLEPGDWAKWLGEETASVEELKAMLRPSTREFDMRRATKPRPEPSRDQAELF